MKNNAQKLQPIATTASVDNNKVVIDKTNNLFLRPSATGSGFNGIHGNNSWYDKSARLFDSGELEIEYNLVDGSAVFHFGGASFACNIETILQAVLYEGITNNRLEECFSVWQKGFLGASQARESEKGREMSLLEKYPIFAELEFSSVSRQKGSKLLNIMKDGITQSDLSAIESAGYKVSGRILSDDLLSPAVIGLKIEVPAEE